MGACFSRDGCRLVQQRLHRLHSFAAVSVLDSRTWERQLPQLVELWGRQAMSRGRPSWAICRGVNSGGDVAEQVIDDEGRPQDGFDDSPHMGPESVGVLPVVDKGSDESQTVDRASAAAPHDGRGLRRA